MRSPSSEPHALTAFSSFITRESSELDILDGTSGATLIPPAYGFAGVNMGTSKGYGSTTYCNAFVANLEMHGKGTFYDARLNDPNQLPIVVKAGSWNMRNDPDMITAKLAALHLYQLAIPAPSSPSAENALNLQAQRGKLIFNGKARCGTVTCRRFIPNLVSTRQ